MPSFDECFQKVKTDCFKFISSQETKTEKFKNKGRMIRSFLIPICFWISKKASKKKPLIIGLAGGQGIGKTTITSIISIILKKYFKLDIFKISIDDFYKTRKQRTLLSKNKHSLLMTRGVPGTHDIDIMLNFFKRIKVKNFKKGNLKIKGSPKTDKVLSIENKKFRISIKSGNGGAFHQEPENTFISFLKKNTDYYRPSDVSSLKGNPNKAKKYLGWYPKTKFKDFWSRQKNPMK